ncbi:MAG: AAA family ATPase [Clostridiales bacterium]|nr:AAA family ATPase [Clostridiales bacterium]
MSVKVTVYGADKESDEYQAAVKLKEIIINSVPHSAEGQIVLFASATLMGQAVKDVDLIMIGELHNYYIDAEFSSNGNRMIKDRVDIGSFCTTIEIKRHDISGIFVNGTDFYVYYGRDKHCVTLQSNKQKISAMNFFRRVISYSPYITNVIWFTQATNNEIQGLCTHNGKKMLSNVIGNDFTFKELIQLLIYQKPPYKVQGSYKFDSNNSCSVGDIQKALLLFSETKEQMGDLTRRRIEQISNKSFSANSLVDTKGKVSIYRGRAGTGKTVGLIQTAIKLVDEEQSRVLILTYNKALVSDIRRLFALAELPDMFEENCVFINTMHSYFFKLCNTILYEGRMSGDKFIDNYERVLSELNNFLKDEESLMLVKEICGEERQLDWDYVLIDEAQDWSNLERDIILKLFEKGKIIVADGGQQFVRNIDVCDWSVVRERNNIKLKYCLRQKENLVHFLNVYLKKMDILGGKILTNNNMPGGKVIIISDDKLLATHHEEIKRMKAAGNIAYDMLYLVPHALVSKKNGKNEFSLKEQFEDNGIAIWDGIDNSSRDSYSINAEEIRVLQYDSSRGLEGWTVVCMDFDTFMEEKSNEYVDGEVNSLLLESPEERKKKYLYNWSMIPLTRGIDTIVITLKNQESTVGRLLKNIASECSDFISWI